MAALVCNGLICNGGLFSSPETPIDEFFERDYLVHLAGSKASTVRLYRTDVRLFVQWCTVIAGLPRPRVCDFSMRLVQGCMAWMAAPLEDGGRGDTNATANRVRATLCAIWNYAHKLDEPLIARGANVKKFKVPKREPDDWSIEEFNRILEAAAEEQGFVGDVPAASWWIALLYFVYNTGCRITAAMRCPTERLALEGDSPRVLIPAEVQKQNADQSFALLAGTVEALRAIKPSRLTEIFEDWPYDRTCVQWPALNNRLKRILARAGLPIGRRHLWHKFRRTTVSIWASKAGLGVASMLAGHSSEAVTKGYVASRHLNLPSVKDLLPEPKPQIQLRLFRPEERQTG